jgi:predicted nucleic acid-binding Zn ribbon protein
MNHKVKRVDNLMYKGCEPHWKCIYCGDCIPFHCYKNEQIESMECKGAGSDKIKKLKEEIK